MTGVFRRRRRSLEQRAVGPPVAGLRRLMRSYNANVLAVQSKTNARAVPRIAGKIAIRPDGRIKTMNLAQSGHDDPPTRERIKRAARTLIALNGVDAVTVRDVVKEAGQKNASALNYYFGSKESLIEALVRDALTAANARWDEAL